MVARLNDRNRITTFIEKLAHYHLFVGKIRVVTTINYKFGLCLSYFTRESVKSIWHNFSVTLSFTLTRSSDKFPDCNHLARSHHGGRSLRSIGWAFYSYGIQSRSQKAMVCAKKKFLWNQADCICKDRNVWSISRWLQYVLSRQQVSSAQTKAVCSAQSKYLYKLANNFRNILHKIISHKISFSVLKKIKVSLNPNYSHISSILQRKNMKKR